MSNEPEQQPSAETPTARTDPSLSGGIPRSVPDPRTALSTWVELDADAVKTNLTSFRRRVPEGTLLQAVVKSNAYGHGLEPIARVAARSGADLFGVHTVAEAERVATLATGKPVLILGYLTRGDAGRAVACGAEVTVYNIETLEALSSAAVAAGREVRCHIKVETGVHRQGIMVGQIEGFLDATQRLPGLAVAGVSTHFANIEDTTDHSYAKKQLARFREISDQVRRRVPTALRHCACSAAVLTMPETSFDMVRIGIGLYGLWPSKETLLSCLMERREEATLHPVLTWKARLAQVKELPPGVPVGYGCSHRTTRPTRLGVLPIGFADGFDRRLSGIGHVLVAGRRVPVLGRVCMNIVLCDLTDIKGGKLEDEVVLIGRQGSETIGAETIASLCNTISYEIVSAITPSIDRFVVDRDGHLLDRTV